jgi:hypothetical protein
MLRARLVPLGGLALLLYAGCGGDSDGGDETAQGGSSAGSEGRAGSSSAGSSGAAGAGSGASASGGNGGGTSLGATYTAAQACRLFAQATCDKGVECGLVLQQVANQLICVQCNALALGFIEQACTEDSPGAKDAAAVDRCVANIAAEPCARACSEVSAPGCDVFGELDGGAEPVVCDVRCAG